MINWKIRFKNPVFCVQFVLAILAPILAYMGISLENITTWGYLLDVIKTALLNPYVLALVFISAWNAVNDPTTAGIKDSKRALGYTELNK